MAAGWRRCTGVLPTDVPFRRWTLGFRQSSFSRIAQALRGRTVHAFRRSPLHVHALVPTSFRIRVSRSPRSHLPRTPANFVGNSLGAYHGAHFAAHGSSRLLLEEIRRLGKRTVFFRPCFPFGTLT